MTITVFRAGHRPYRDKRITTHVALVARAFGADSILVDTKDSDLEETVNRVTSEFGGEFRIVTGVNWIKEYRKFAGVKVYLTMYGESVDNAAEKVRIRMKNENVAVLVGAEKMPPEGYALSDFNIAVTNQPHSEVAALAIFLDRIQHGDELGRSFKGHAQIVPTAKGKIVRILPDRRECFELLKKYDASEHIIRHTEAVASLALKIGELAGADLKLVEAGALLHDIGRTKTNGIDHASAGAEILRSESIVDDVVNMVERHTGAGLTKEEARGLGLPLKDYMPVTIEEKIVAHADNLVNGEKVVPLSETLVSYRAKGLDKAADRIKTLHDELKNLCGVDPDLIR